MDIRELFNWLQGEEEALHLSDKVLTQDFLEREQRQAEKTHQILLREVRAAKYSGGVVTEKINELEKHILFMEYLKFCSQKFSANSLLFITLKYLLTKEVQKEQSQLIAKVNQLFLVLFQENKESTLAFYKENKELFKNYHEIREKVDLELFEIKIDEAAETVKKNLLDLNKLLSHQEKPLGIVGLFREYIGDTERFASLILWLVHHGVNSEKILQTYLLHDFLKYHFFTLHDKNNEIVRLYALLNRFPQAKTLLEEVKKTASDERGLQQYSLNGLVHEKKLQSIEPQDHPFEFSQIPENFLNLHELFGLPFLIEAIINSSEHIDPKWQETLKQTLNKTQVVTKELSGILHLIASKYSPSVLKDLADLIDDITAQELLSNNEGAVLYLIPYKLKLFTAINEKNITELIQQISIKHPNDPEIVYQLAALFTAFSRNKHSATPLVFQALIDSLILHPHLLEDEELLKQLKKYPESGRLLSQRYEVIAQQFNDCILEQTAESAFSSRNYQIIEDSWVDATRKVAALALIKPQPKFNFGHKYAFQAKIAEIAFLHHGERFDLSVFIEALSLPPITSLDVVSEYERTLIEILAAIDNELLRKQIIEKLETSPIERLAWRYKEYEGKTVFLKAAKYGNLGLIMLLENEVASQSLNNAILIAAKENQWKAVDYLAQLDKTILSQDEIEIIVRLAAQQGQVNIIQYLYDTYDYEPSTHEIATILKQAITNNNVNVVKYFYQSSFAFPKQAVINNLFNLAIEVEALDVIPFIAEAENNNPTLSTVEKAFEQATLNQQLEIIQTLCNLSSNTPRPVVIERAFIKACQLGLFFAVQYFNESLEKLVSQSTFKNAFEQAIINEHTEIVTYFCNSSINPPGQSLIDQGIISAAKIGTLSLIEYFCSMTSHKPSQRAITQALYQAINHDHPEVFTTLCRNSMNPPNKASINDSLLFAVKKGRQNIVEYLCENEIEALKQDTIEKALILAAKFKQPEIVRYLCEIPEKVPGKKAMRNALNKAIGGKQTEIIDYLRERLQDNSNHQAKMESEVGDIHKLSEPLSTHGFFKASKVSQIGKPHQANDYELILS